MVQAVTGPCVFRVCRLPLLLAEEKCQVHENITRDGKSGMHCHSG